jgi:membrane protease YdiL (CAAX protease family)
MATDSQGDEELRIAEMPASTLSAGAASNDVPRIWTVFAAYLAAFAGSVLVQIIAAMAVAIWYVAQGGSISQLAGDLAAMLSTPAAFIVLALMAQIVMGSAAIIPARLSTEPTSERLGLVAAGLPMWAYVIIAVGSLLPLALGIAAAIGVAQVIKPDTSVQRLYEQMTWAWAVPFVLFIALVPGFVEETFFRGYMQRRLLKRWPPAPAILVTTVLFGIMHIMPHAVANALVVGLWLGVLAWRTGSVWPGVVSHAFINGSWNIWQIGKILGVFAPTPSMVATASVGAVVLASFLASVWLLAQRRLPDDSPPVEAPEPMGIRVS